MVIKYDCVICGAETDVIYVDGLPWCFDCICDSQENQSERIKKSVELHTPQSLKPTINELKTIVCQFCNIPEMDKITRKREIVEARQVAMYLAKKLKLGSLRFIGNNIGGKDHATVLHSCKTVQNLLDTDKAFYKTFNPLIKIYL